MRKQQIVNICYLGDGLLEAGLGLLPLRQMHLADGQTIQQHRRGAVLLNQLVIDIGSLLRLAPALFVRYVRCVRQSVEMKRLKRAIWLNIGK